MIIVDKSQRILKLLKDGSIVKTYNIDLGFEPIGHKQKRGDGKTPEGLYYINKKKRIIELRYLNINYRYE